MNNPSIYDISPIMEEVLAGGGTLKLQPHGISMLPFIMEGRDEVLLQKVSLPPKKGMIYLYKRENGSIVLHRCIEVGKALTFRGDNQYRKEVGVLPENLMAQVVSVRRKGKTIVPHSFLYFCYAHMALLHCIIKRMLYRIFRLHKQL